MGQPYCILPSLRTLIHLISNRDPLLSGRQVDLHTLKVLTGIATQGAISKDTQKSYYVTTFKLEVSTNGEDWMIYRHGKNHKVGRPHPVHCSQAGTTRWESGKVWRLRGDGIYVRRWLLRPQQPKHKRVSAITALPRPPLTPG